MAHDGWFSEIPCSSKRQDTVIRPVRRGCPHLIFPPNPSEKGTHTSSPGQTHDLKTVAPCYVDVGIAGMCQDVSLQIGGSRRLEMPTCSPTTDLEKDS